MTRKAAGIAWAVGVHMPFVMLGSGCGMVELIGVYGEELVLLVLSRIFGMIMLHFMRWGKFC
jgi:hypothetical protein